MEPIRPGAADQLIRKQRAVGNAQCQLPGWLGCVSPRAPATVLVGAIASGQIWRSRPSCGHNSLIAPAIGALGS